MQDTRIIRQIRRKDRALRVELDERVRRQWAAAEAREPGWGGVVCVARATGLSRTTITAGLRELDFRARQWTVEAARVRRPGGGRKPLIQTDPDLLAALESLIEPAMRGDPQSPLCWTCKSIRRLADELTHQHQPVGANELELGVAIRMRRALLCLAVGLKTVASLMPSGP